MSKRNTLSAILLIVLFSVMMFGIGKYLDKTQAIPLDQRTEISNALQRLIAFKYGPNLLKTDYVSTNLLKQALKTEALNLPSNIYLDLMHNIEKDESEQSTNFYFVTCISGYVSSFNYPPGTILDPFTFSGTEPKTSDKFCVRSVRTKIKWDLTFTGNPFEVTITLMKVFQNKTTKDIAVIKTSEIKGELTLNYGTDNLQIKVGYLKSRTSKLSWKVMASEVY